ncbi:cysteine--tRNA ligase [Cuniculiplasma sp. SKW4]|uniref:cysteine--tRNA ligase n=1 Tax=Cuniculiplasma sp. SKW4 TaxID=3400171 RepID=UPI003FD4290A
MRIWNELTGSYTVLKNKSNTLKVYVCGPTVYDTPHLGHLKTYIIYDSMVKYLRYSGFSVLYIQNITDVDDKIINKAIETNEDAIKLSEKYTEEYISLMRRAGIDSVSFYARATKSIKDIITMIKMLDKRGYVYRLPDGVYFRVWMDKEYGVLSKQVAEKQVSGKRAQVSDLKEDPRDFVLWKFRKSGEPYWNSPWGEGRPGWHIEDSAIIRRYIGAVLDIHGAGADLKFPHNESELALLRCIKGNSNVCKTWTYSGLIRINGEKMSKSLNNGISAREVLERYSKEVVRYMFLSSNYSSEMDFSWDLMEQSAQNVMYLNRAFAKLNSIRIGKGKLRLKDFLKTLLGYLDDNFNTRMVLVTLGEIASEIFKHDELDEEEVINLREAFKIAQEVLGVVRDNTIVQMKSDSIESMLELRRTLKEKKMYKESDWIRKALSESGITVEDSGNDVTWFKQ